MDKPTVTLTVQKWGNSLAVRIPVVIAKGADLHIGNQVEMIYSDGNILIKPTGIRKISLDEKLAAFDPKLHGGEIMPSKLVGQEKL